MSTYSGSGHCGAVRFEVTCEPEGFTTCDCTLCVKKNALMYKVHEDRLTVVKGENDLILYQWNPRRANHCFCRNCGIYTFHRKRAEPDHFGVNVFCVEGLPREGVPVRATDGINMPVAES